MRVCDYIVRFLTDRDVTDVFVLTGNGAMYLNDALTLDPKIKYYCARNEAAAPMMAEAYARVKQKLAVVCVTSGPGSTNAIPGLAEAFVDSAPIFILSGQVQRNHTTYNLPHLNLRTYGTAEINIVPIVRPLTKYAEMVNDAADIRFHMEKAYHLATHGRPGPVWLDIPMDIQQADIDPDKLRGFSPPEEPKLNLDAQVQEVVKLLKNSKRPLIIAGNGIRQGRAVDEFIALVRDLSTVPVMFSRFGQDLMPYSHPNVLGQTGLKGTRFCATAMRQADLIISLGCRLAVQLVGHNFDAFDPSAKVIMVDIESDELRKPGQRIDLPINADVKYFMPKLSAGIKKETGLGWADWLSQCIALKNANPMVTSEYQRNPIDLYYFMSKLDQHGTENHIFTTDAGSNYYVGGQVYHFENGSREITSGTFAAMGLSIPLAIGAAAAEPSKQILAVTGDGSLELNVQELKTISYYGLNIKLFVINNGGYVSMRKWQDTYFDGRRIGSDNETGAETLRLDKVAEAFDMPYDRIERYEEIDTKLDSILKKSGPVFIEVFTDNNQKIFQPIVDKNY